MIQINIEINRKRNGGDGVNYDNDYGGGDEKYYRQVSNIGRTLVGT